MLAGLLGVTALAGFSARSLQFDFNPDNVFSSDNAAIKYAEQFRKQFDYNDTVIIIGLEAMGNSSVVSATAALHGKRDGRRSAKAARRQTRREPDLDEGGAHISFSLSPS